MLSQITTAILLASSAFAAGAPALPIRNLGGGVTHAAVRRAGAASVGHDSKVLAGAPVNNITISTSNVVQCATAYISWTGATDPVDLSIGQGGFYIGITPITTLSAISGGSATWQVNAASGEYLIFEVKDAKGTVGYVQNVKVGTSSDSSCLAASAAVSASASPSASAAAASPSSSTAGGDAAAQGSDAGVVSAAAASAASPTAAVTTAVSASTSSKSSTTSATSTTFTPVLATTAASSAGLASLAGANSPSASGKVSGASRKTSSSLALCLVAIVLKLAL